MWLTTKKEKELNIEEFVIYVCGEGAKKPVMRFIVKGSFFGCLHDVPLPASYLYRDNSRKLLLKFIPGRC